MTKELEVLVDGKIEYYKATLSLAEGLGRLEDGRRLRETISHFEEIKQALTELEELKKRDMAMKPVEAMITWQCGKCGKEIRNTFNSCPYCRTRIDWSCIYGSEER